MKKYRYLRVIQQHYNVGTWEDSSEYETKSNFLFNTKTEKDLFLHDLVEYKLTGYPTRYIKRRELLTK